MASQIAEREDSLLCSDVRNKLFGPMEFSRRDLGALNIMRGRDMGLPDYNAARISYRMEPVTEWEQINPELAAEQPELFRKLAELHGNDLSNLDVYLGNFIHLICQLTVTVTKSNRFQSFLSMLILIKVCYSE